MCGTEYCGVCATHARLHGIDAWAQGLRHRTPSFGDWNQRRVAIRHREALFNQLKVEDPRCAREFPEFVVMVDQARDVDRFIQRLQGAYHKHFDRLLRMVPGLADFVTAEPYVVPSNLHGKCHRKARIKNHKRWESDSIRNFVRSLGMDELHGVYQAVAIRAPSWLEPTGEEVSQARDITQWLGIDPSQPMTERKVLTVS